MTLRLRHGTVDPHYRLAHGAVEDMLGGYEPSREQIEAINEAIEAFAEADPMGYSDHEADRLKLRVARILASSEHKEG